MNDCGMKSQSRRMRSAFESGVFLLTKARAKALRAGTKPVPETVIKPSLQPGAEEVKKPDKLPEASPGVQTRTLRLVGTVPPEIWNRLGTKIIPKLKSGTDLKIGVEFSVTLGADAVTNMESDLRQILEDLGLGGKIRIEWEG